MFLFKRVGFVIHSCNIQSKYYEFGDAKNDLRTLILAVLKI